MPKYALDFYFDLFEKGIFPEVVDNVLYSSDNSKMQRPQKSPTATMLQMNGLFYLNNVPDYLDLKLKPGYKSKTFPLAKGFMADLSGYMNFSDYLKNNLKPRLRTAVKSSIRRLELSFNITYRVFYGEISQEEYDSLVNSLYHFILRRFDELKEENARINEWERFHQLFLPLIRQKKASLFVIYNDGKPINISLNYHYDKIFFYAIPGFDIDYSKFGLGHIMLYKQIEWCFQNNYKHFDMSMGDLDYKRQWCTNDYYFERHLIYLPKSLNQSILAQLVVFSTKMKLYLKSKNIHLIYLRLIRLLKGKKPITEQETTTELGNIQAYTTPLESIELKEYILCEIDFKYEKYSFLLRHLYDYLFTHQLPINDLIVYEIKPNKEYIINGPTTKLKLVLSATRPGDQ